MMIFAKVMGFFLVVAVVLMGGAEIAYADSLCKNVKFEFTNKDTKSDKIRVVKIKYYDTTDKKWRTEVVKNTECAYLSTCTTKGDGLGYVENENVTPIRFIYQWLKFPWQTSGKWSANVEGGNKTPKYAKCVKNKVYRKAPGQPFVIWGQP